MRFPNKSGGIARRQREYTEVMGISRKFYGIQNDKYKNELLHFIVSYPFRRCAYSSWVYCRRLTFFSM